MQNLPEVLKNVFTNNSEPDAVFSALLPILSDVLQSDRCFLYLRNPFISAGKTPYCWVRRPDVFNVATFTVEVEPESLPQEDPLFAAALRTDPTIFVEDVETADPKVVNLAFEQKSFGHRALIHAHLCHDGMLWGVLQPCIFGQPRVWSEFDRAIIAQVEKIVTPLAVAYVKQEIPN
ncbi:MAG: GAF domain-containing protein [Chroococcus sp. CMT-3BRIN-NPC107]|jgi:hypothetical protein|nr:GAF domain-containing protein [Chroococcus sp. CMT-3BRIN-NPC107]